MNQSYTYRLHSLPCPGHAQPLTRAIVYQGTQQIATTAAYEHNAGCGVAAAIKDARAIIDGQRAVNWFQWSPLDDLPKVVSPTDVLTVDAEGVASDNEARSSHKESRPQMVKDFLSTYTTIIIATVGILALVMKGCG
jgi:hypothetical protein